MYTTYKNTRILYFSKVQNSKKKSAKKTKAIYFVLWRLLWLIQIYKLVNNVKNWLLFYIQDTEKYCFNRHTANNKKQKKKITIFCNHCCKINLKYSNRYTKQTQQYIFYSVLFFFLCKIWNIWLQFSCAESLAVQASRFNSVFDRCMIFLI